MIRRQIGIFLVVGVLTVVLDFLLYSALYVFTPLPVAVAKAAGFIGGTIFAYVVNKCWTFGRTAHRAGSLWRFVLLYGATLAANVGVNSLVLGLAGRSEQAVGLAFLVATGVSATLNFVGMKHFVFTAGKPVEPA